MNEISARLLVHSNRPSRWKTPKCSGRGRPQLTPPILMSYLEPVTAETGLPKSNGLRYPAVWLFESIFVKKDQNAKT